MRPNHTDFTSRASVAIVRVACVAAVLTAWSDRAFAQAGDNGPKPASTVEVGLGGVTDGSFKAGEYNGLQNKGVFGVANVDLRGGGAYGSDNAMRWRVRGTNLGLETRSLAAEVGIQGRYRATFLYDELLHNRSDTYQTPLLGAGTNSLTLPGSWLVPNVPSSAAGNNRGNTNSARGLVPSIGHASYIDTQTGSPTIGQVIAPNAAQLAKVDAALVADLPLFANVDLSTKRTKFGAGLGYDFTPAVVAKVSFVGEHKDGLQPLGTVSRNTGGDISTILPLKIDSDTNQVDSSVAYKSDRGLVQAGYYASLYNNNVGSMSWQNWATGANATAAGTTNTISTAPSNTLHQFNFSGRYNFSKATRLVAHGSYGRNSQNDAFITNATTPVVPESSLNGLVVYSAFSAKVTSRPAKKLNLTAQYKFDDRNDKTNVLIFQYADAEEAASPNTNFPAGPNNPLGAVLAQNANANRPYSRKLNLVGGEAEYALQGHQWVKGGYDYQRTDYWCNGSWIDCAVAAKVNSNTVKAEWRANVSETLNARVDYAFDMRRTPGYNENSFLSMVPYANVVPVGATGGQSAYAFMVANGWNGYGPTLGFATTTGNMNLYFPSNNALANTFYANNNRISEIQGMRRYFVSDRDRQKLRSSADWQAREALSFEGSVDFTGDTYTDATYGLQEARAWASNLDATYTIEDGLSATAFYTYEHLSSASAGNSYTANSNAANVNGFTALSGNSGCDSYTTLQQRNNNNKIDPCLNWFSDIRDRVHTIGFTLDKKAAKLDVSGSLLFSSARGDNTMTGGSWANNPLALPGAPAGTIAAYFIPATSLPTVPTDTSELRLNGKYTVDSHQLLRVFYSFMHMKSSDWAYDGMQTGLGTIAGVLPTNEQAFNYNVNIIGASYIVTF